jgi:outer membrane immunogenic protein
MKRLLLGCVPLIALAGISAAPAADLRMPVKAPPMAASFNWSGCSIGGYVGGAWNGNDGAVFTDQGQNGLGAAGSTATPPFLSYSGGATAARIVSPHSWDADLGVSFIGGGTLGCNWQAAGSPFVFGVEGEAGYMRLRGQAFDPATIVSTQTTLDALGTGKAGDWYGMVAGRLGYAWDRTLLYVKGGVAFVPTKSSVIDTCQNTVIGCGNWLISTSGSNTVTTWTAGGGIEWALGGNWSVKGEYMFIALGDDNGSQHCGTVTTPSGAPLAGGPFCFNNSFGGIHTAKLGLNYSFGRGGY